MKLFLLAFAIISFLAQTTQGGWREKKCYNNEGRCKSHCKSNEKDYSTCPNKKKCCVPRDKLPADSQPGTGSGSSPGGEEKPPSAGALTPRPGGASAGAPVAPFPGAAIPGAAAGNAATTTPAGAASTQAPAAAASTTAAAAAPAETTTGAPGGE